MGFEREVTFLDHVGDYQKGVTYLDHVDEFQKMNGIS